MVSCGGLFCHDTAGFLVRSGKSGVPRLIGWRELLVKSPNSYLNFFTLVDFFFLFFSIF